MFRALLGRALALFDSASAEDPEPREESITPVGVVITKEARAMLVIPKPRPTIVEEKPLTGSARERYLRATKW